MYLLDILLVSFVLLAAAGRHLLGLSGGNGLHSQFHVIVVILTIGALTVGLFLFLDFLSLLAVNGISATNMLVCAGLDHARQSPEQPEHCGCGLLVDVILHLFQ